jgi:hypothetical protein
LDEKENKQNREGYKLPARRPEDPDTLAAILQPLSSDRELALNAAAEENEPTDFAAAGEDQKTLGDMEICCDDGTIIGGNSHSCRRTSSSCESYYSHEGGRDEESL